MGQPTGYVSYGMPSPQQGGMMHHHRADTHHSMPYQSQPRGQYMVYDMKSLSSALATIQAGTGEIRKIFQASTFRPRLPGLTKLVSQLTREGNWQKGLEVFETLNVIGVRPDTTITNAAISACDKGGQWEKAMQIFNNMEDWGLQRDAITYSAAISALAKGRQWSLAIDVFNHMCNAGVECDAVTCCSLITALDKGGQWQLAEQVFIQMYAEHPQFQVLLQYLTEDSVIMPSVCSGLSSPSQTLSRTRSLSLENLSGGVGSALSRPLSNEELNELLSSSHSITGDVDGGLAMMGRDMAAAGGLPQWSSQQGRLFRSVSAIPGNNIPKIDEDLPSLQGNIWEAKADLINVWPDASRSSGGGVGGGLGLPPQSPAASTSGSFMARFGQYNSPLCCSETASLASDDTAFITRSPSGQPIFSQPQLSSLLSGGNMGGLLPASLSDVQALLGATDMAKQQQQQQHLISMGAVNGILSPSNISGPVLQRSASSASQQYQQQHQPQHQQRGLLRTSSLNTKKSAPNRVCCNALLAAYARAQPTQWQKAIRLLELMWQIGGELCPDIVSYNTVIKACGNAQQIDLGYKVYHLMCKRSVEPTVATFGTLICIASDAQQSGRVKEAWGWLQASGLEVHITCANAYLQALIKEGDFEDAERLFHTLLLPSSPVRANAITFSIMMSAYLTKDQPDKVKKLFEDMFAAGVQPSANIYTMLVNAYAQRGQWDDSISILNYMCRSDSTVRPALGTFNSLFAALTTAAESADEGQKRELTKRMAAVRALLKMQGGAHTDMSVYRNMINAFQAVGECDVVVELFNLMISQHMVVDADVAAAVLEAVAVHKSWDKVVQVLKVLQEQGPALPLEVIKKVLMMSAQSQAWIPVYRMLKASCLGGDLAGLMALLKSEGQTDLLFMALLVEKEALGAWMDALNMFKWLQQVQKSEFSISKEAYCIMFELLFVHGGIEGLHQAVLLCKEAHDKKLLQYYTAPARNEPAGEEAATAAAAGSMPPQPPQLQGAVVDSSSGSSSSSIVRLEGESRVQAIVVMLSWLLMLRDCARQGARVHSSFVDVVMACNTDCLDMQQFKAAVALVLEGSYAAHLPLQGCTPEQQDAFVLRRPVMYCFDPNNQAMIHVNVQSVYQQLGV